MNNYQWTELFQQCYDKAVAKYREGNRQPARYFSKPEAAFLASIGCSAQEVYDLAEDWCGGQEPSFAQAVLITAARRDYFLVIQKSRPSRRTILLEKFPPKDAELAGLVWLPRIIAKARAKLRGELPAELMYGCGGDRAFLRMIDTDPADFLRVVWSARDNDQPIINYVKKQAAPRKPAGRASS